MTTARSHRSSLSRARYLALRCVTDQALGVCEGHIRWRGTVAHVIGCTQIADFRGACHKAGAKTCAEQLGSCRKRRVDHVPEVSLTNNFHAVVHPYSYTTAQAEHCRSVSASKSFQLPQKIVRYSGSLSTVTAMAATEALSMQPEALLLRRIMNQPVGGSQINSNCWGLLSHIDPSLITQRCAQLLLVAGKCGASMCSNQYLFSHCCAFESGATHQALAASTLLQASRRAGETSRTGSPRITNSQASISKASCPSHSSSHPSQRPRPESQRHRF